MFNWFPYTNFHNLNLDWILRKLKEIPTKTSELENDSGFITAAQAGAVTSVNGQTGDVTISVPAAGTSTPEDLGTAAAGISDDYAREDHVHKMPTLADIGTPTPADIGAAPAAAALPSGGAANDVLMKDSSVDYDASWKALKVKVWENPSLGTFAAQTIASLDLSEYYYIIIDFSVAGSATALIPQFGIVGVTTGVQYNTAYSNKLRQFSRDFTVNTSSVQFFDAQATTEGANTTVNNALLVPYRIWGVRI